jgi:probable rRNA maturation factor
LAIQFHELEISAGIRKKNLLTKWLTHVIGCEGKSAGNINVIFTTEKKLYDLNKQYLSKDTLTDIITFDYSENQIIAGDLFISIPRVAENAATYNTEFAHELKRVIIHGILHLLGHEDKNNRQKADMRRMEDLYLKDSPEI